MEDLVDWTNDLVTTTLSTEPPHSALRVAGSGLRSTCPLIQLKSIFLLPFLFILVYERSLYNVKHQLTQRVCVKFVYAGLFSRNICTRGERDCETRKIIFNTIQRKSSVNHFTSLLLLALGKLKIADIPPLRVL